MITNKGSDIVSRYLLGQAPEYAAYIAVGVGARPLTNTEADNSLPTKKTMDFEAFRAPVISRGIVNDSVTKPITSITTVNTGAAIYSTATCPNHNLRVGEEISIHITNQTIQFSEVTSVTDNTFTYPSGSAIGTITPTSAWVAYSRDRLIFKAQLPPDQRYEMSEIAVYPAINNQLAVGHDSKILASFTNNEPWTLFGSSQAIEFSSATISNQYNTISPSFSAKFINSDNMAFAGSSVRRARYEHPRFLNKCLIVNGGLCSFATGTYNPMAGSIYLSNTNISLDLSKYSSKDVLKLAFSIVSESETSLPPAAVLMRLDLVDPDGKIVSMRQTYTSTQISSSRYVVMSSTIADMDVPDQTFNWSKIVGISIYCETRDSGGSYDGSYIILDGLRIDDENITNPLYGMVAYSRLRNSAENGQTIEKAENSQGYIEYRLGVAIT